MNNKKLIKNKIEDIIECHRDFLTGNEMLNEIEGWDSLAIIGLIAMIDQDYNISIRAEEIIQCIKINDIITLIESKIQKS